VGGAPREGGDEGKSRKGGREGGKAIVKHPHHLTTPPSLPPALLSGPRWRGSHGSGREDPDAGWVCGRRDKGHVGL